MKKSSCILLALIFSLSGSLSAQGHHSFPLKDASKSYVRLLFAGDAMQHSVQYKWAWNPNTKTYDYEPNFRYLRPHLAEADINVVNFETTLSGEPYSGYPRFRSPDAYFHELLDAGFQVFGLANNHVIDGDKEGFARTLEKLSPYPNMGAYMDTAQRSQQYPLIFHIDGMKIALFTATYGTNQLLPVAPNWVNYIETEQLEIDMAKTMQDSTIDLRIMYIHWGTEYELLHNAFQAGVGQWLADLGIDLIIGSHSHVVQDYEVVTAKDGRRVPIVYGLGNLISNQLSRFCRIPGGNFLLHIFRLNLNRLHFRSFWNGVFNPQFRHRRRNVCIFLGLNNRLLNFSLCLFLPDRRIHHESTLCLLIRNR